MPTQHLEERPRERMRHSFIPVSLLSSDVLFRIIEFVGPVDLHHTIPFINKVFYDTLNEKCTTETSGNFLLDKYSCTKANVLWKQYFSKKRPTITTITKDYLYNYRKMYCNKFKMSKYPHM